MQPVCCVNYQKNMLFDAELCDNLTKVKIYLKNC